MKVYKHVLSETSNIDILDLIGNKKAMLISTTKFRNAPVNLDVLDINNFKINSWRQKINMLQYEMVVFKINFVGSDFVHAFYMNSYNHVHIFVPENCDTLLLHVDDYKIQQKIFYLDPGKLQSVEDFMDNPYSCSDDRYNYINSHLNSKLAIYSADKRIFKLFPSVRNAYDVVSDRRNVTCVVLDFISGADYSGFKEIVYFVSDTSVLEKCEVMKNIVHSVELNRNIKAFFKQQIPKIGNACFPVNYAQQVLISIINEAKAKLEDINLFIKDLGNDWVHDENFAVLTINFFDIYIKSNFFVKKIDKINDAAHKAIIQLYNSGFIDDTLTIITDVLYRMEIVDILLKKVYGTTDTAEIESIRNNFLLKNYQIGKSELVENNGKLIFSVNGAFQNAVKKFKQIHGIYLPADINKDMGMAGYNVQGVFSSAEPKNGVSIELFETLYRKIPKVLESNSDSWYLYTFSIGNTGILCAKGFDYFSIVDTNNQSFTIKQRTRIRPSYNQILLLKFYQIIFFQISTTCYPKSLQAFKLFYYATPLIADRKDAIDWGYLENIFNNFIKCNLLETTDYTTNILWNPFTRNFLLYDSDFNKSMEDNIGEGTFYEHFEELYKVRLVHKTGKHIFRCHELSTVASFYKSKYLKQQKGLLNEKEISENYKYKEYDSASSASNLFIISPKEVCFITSVKKSIIKESVLFIKNFGIFETACIANEFNELLDLKLPLSLLSQAFTHSRENPFRDYERLEFLGDSALKFLVTNYLCIKGLSLGTIVKIKDTYISNENLHAICFASGLYRYITTRSFHYKMFQPPNIAGFDQFKRYFGSYDSYQSNNFYQYISSLNIQNTQDLDKKTYADIMEAVIGCLFITDGLGAVMRFLYNVKLIEIPENNLGHIKKYAKKDFSGKKSDEKCKITGFDSINASKDRNNTIKENIHVISASEFRKTCCTDVFPFHNKIKPQYSSIIPFKDILKIQEMINYEFNNLGLLEKAFTHPSFSQNIFGSETFQILELMGDCAFDLFVVHKVYKNSAYASPFDMHSAKCSFVSNQLFGSIIINMDFHKYLKIADNYEFNDTFKTTWDGKTLPKIFGDIFEAMVGAILCDLDWDFENFSSVIENGLWKLVKHFHEKYNLSV